MWCRVNHFVFFCFAFFCIFFLLCNGWSLVRNEYHENDPHIFEKVIWSDEAQFKLNGYVNRHHCVYYHLDNPNLINEKQLNQPGVQVWGGVSLNAVYGPSFFEGNVTGADYKRKCESSHKQ